jgi:hypothetical protein
VPAKEEQEGIHGKDIGEKQTKTRRKQDENKTNTRRTQDEHKTKTRRKQHEKENTTTTVSVLQKPRDDAHPE